MSNKDKLIDLFRVPGDEKIRLKDYDPAWAGTKEMRELSDKEELKERALEIIEENRQRLAAAQDKLYAADSYAVLLVFQAMDAAGKDGVIKHVMTGVNPQGVQVSSFKTPSDEELSHDFLWRCYRVLPERGRIGVFNRSYYEEVLVVRVHPEFLVAQKLPPGKRNQKFWEDRYDSINDFERHLVRNGTLVLKFFLNVSRDEQKKRFLERLENPDKNWKFSTGDLKERGFWDQYQEAYEEMLNATSTKWAPWFVVPADHKWVTRAVVSTIIADSILALGVDYPEVPADQHAALAEAKQQLEAEK
jgi:PPK2 family polyphosphate:nucleotide phosphotransferase